PGPRQPPGPDHQAHPRRRARRGGGAPETRRGDDAKTPPPGAGAPPPPPPGPHPHPPHPPLLAPLRQPGGGLLAPRAGERILDLGCGDGALTKRLADLGADVIGVDASPEMVAAAQALSLDARVMSGEALTFDGEFDAVFSNAALHWMLRPALVIA